MQRSAMRCISSFFLPFRSLLFSSFWSVHLVTQLLDGTKCVSKWLEIEQFIIIHCCHVDWKEEHEHKTTATCTFQFLLSSQPDDEWLLAFHSFFLFRSLPFHENRKYSTPFTSSQYFSIICLFIILCTEFIIDPEIIIVSLWIESCQFFSREGSQAPWNRLHW